MDFYFIDFFCCTKFIGFFFQEYNVSQKPKELIKRMQLLKILFSRSLRRGHHRKNRTSIQRGFKKE